MSIDPRDDFSGFAGLEHMFFGIDDPFALIRSEITQALVLQVPSARVDSIRCEGEPKFLTLGSPREHDSDTIRVSHFANCFRCTIEVATDTGNERLDAALTLCFGPERMCRFLDLYEDAESALTDEVFQQRFFEFRDEE